MAEPLDYQPKPSARQKSGDAASSIPCPNCQLEMQCGRLVIHGTLIGFLAVGFSHQNLYFQWDDPGGKTLLGTSEVKILDNGSPTLAYQCRTCGMMLIPNR